MDLAVTVTNAGRVIEIFERQMAVASTILEFKIPPQTTPRIGFQARIGQNLAKAAALPLTPPLRQKRCKIPGLSDFAGDENERGEVK